MATDVLEQPVGPLEVGPVGFRDVGNYQSTVPKNTEKRRAKLRYCNDAVVNSRILKCAD